MENFQILLHAQNNTGFRVACTDLRQKTEREEKKRERKEERLNDGDNNGEATHGARKHAWPRIKK